MRWESGGRFKREGTYEYLWLIHVAVWQKPTEYYKVIILKLKRNKLKKFKCLDSLSKETDLEISLVAQWIRLHTPSTKGPRFNPWLGN